MSSEKTEQPTDHKLRQAREDGQVPKSKDFTQTLLMGALFSYTLVDSSNLVRLLGQMIVFPAQIYGMDFRDAAAMEVSLLLHNAIELLMPYILIVLIVGIFAEMVQTGVLFSFKSLMPKADKLNPVANLKQMFSMKNIIEFVKSNLKVAFLTILVYFVVRDSLAPLIKIPPAGIGAVGLALAAMLKKLVIYTFVGFGAIALFDLVYQRYSYIKGLMMSMEEIKQEYKQMEGDPHVKGHRRELAKEIAMGEMTQKTRKASVVVTNPTHLAVALYYEEGKTPLPIVLSKGEGLIAKEIVRIAKEEGIPVMQNIPVARALFKTAHIDQYIPSELVEPVAEVLLALKRLAQDRLEGGY
jgi:type III secretion protein U